MIGYVTIGSNDLQRSKAFYLDVLSSLGVQEIMNMERLIMLGSDPTQCMLAICTPYDENAASVGNGNMIAIQAPSQAEVESLHANAIKLGASDEGAPGERGQGFYGAYIRDLDGNKVAFYTIG